MSDTSGNAIDFDILICPKCGAKNAVYRQHMDKVLKCRRCDHRFTKEQAAAAPVTAARRLQNKFPNLSGRQLGHFKLLGVLGSGAMGVVYRAQDTMLMRDVAVKVLPKDISEKDPKGLERFLNEARTAAQIVHPNVVQIFHIAQAEGTYFIAMEYVRGGTAERAAQLRGGRLEEHFAFEKMLEAADALAAAHRRKIFHRDLKPANLLLTTEGSLKIADFGLALWGDSPEISTLANSPHIVGTPQYMAPEQAKGEQGESYSDVYSLGCTFYRLLCGKTPYKASNVMGYFNAHLNAAVPNPLDELPEMNPEMAELMMRCLAKSPVERPTAAQIAQFLRERLGGRRMNAGASQTTMGLSDSQQALLSGAASGDRSVTLMGATIDGGASQTFSAQSNYLSLFGLSFYPFNDVRNPASFWAGGPYAQACDALTGQLELGICPVQLVGAPGSGRTFVATIVQKRLNAHQTLLIQPRLLGNATLASTLCKQANVNNAPEASREDAMRLFVEAVSPPGSEDRRLLIVVDEVKPEQTELLADLAALIHTTSDRPNFAILLVGPPELDADLAAAGVPLDLRGQGEPVLLRGMEENELNSYLDFRMQTVGRAGQTIQLTNTARQLLLRRSQGFPRLINIFCHNALTLAAHTKQDQINTDTLWRAMNKRSYVTSVESLPTGSAYASDVWRRLDLLKALELVN